MVRYLWNRWVLVYGLMTLKEILSVYLMLHAVTSSVHLSLILEVYHSFCSKQVRSGISRKIGIPEHCFTIYIVRRKNIVRYCYYHYPYFDNKTVRPEACEKQTARQVYHDRATCMLTECTPSEASIAGMLANHWTAM